MADKFDPAKAGAWISAEEMSRAEMGAVNHAMYDRWVAKSDSPAPLERTDCGWADLAAVAIKVLRDLRRPKADNE